MIILVLAAIIFLVSMWMANCGKGAASPYERYQQPFPLQSNLNQEQIQQALSNGQCSAAVNTLCSEAKGQNLVLPTKNLSGYLSDVQSSCGAEFPVYGVCAQQDPSFGINTPMILGGTHSNTFGFA